MKKLFLSALAMVGALSLTSCDDFLDSENYTESNVTNYPTRVSDLNKLVAAAYGVLNQFHTDPLQSPWMIWHIMSDEALGAGGETDAECTAIGHFTSNKSDLFDNAWHNTYVGIARANNIIASVDVCDWTGNESDRNQMLGEAYFLRGLFYLWGSQLWGDIPAYWEANAPDPCPQQSAEDVIYPHILSDFVSAMNLLEKHDLSSRSQGHATKVSAEGFLARAYLFYEGFYKQVGELASASPAAVQLIEQEGCSGTLSKQDVIDALDDAINNSGNGLIEEDFRLLWQYTNELTANGYGYVADLYKEGKYWAGDGNIEQIFEVKSSNNGSWQGTLGIGFVNTTALYTSLRINKDVNGHNNDTDGKNLYPFAAGWGQGVFTSYLWDDWKNAEPNDKRRQATIFDGNEGGELSELEETNPWVEKSGIEPYTSIALSTEDCEETGYYNKKWMAYTAYYEPYDDPDVTYETGCEPYTWWGIERVTLGGGSNQMSSFQGDHFNDMVLMRFADILLMKDELAGTADGMNKLRERAGLGSTSYSLDNIKNERRWEFAGEGIRFNDLRRWSGKNPSTSCEAAVALQRQAGSKVYFEGVEHELYCLGGSWAQRYADTKGGFLKIPTEQITVVADENVLTQNPGWIGTDGSSTGMFSY